MPAMDQGIRKQRGSESRLLGKSELGGEYKRSDRGIRFPAGRGVT
jgi:hypothetical protein